MSKTAMIRARTNPELKKNVEEIFHKLGINMTQAVNMFLHQVEIHNGLPFEVALPNKTTLQTFKDTDNGKNLHRCENIEDMFQELDI